ncbi:MAG: hypothetical protein ACKO40_07460 [Planctomycetaceae bacterium]
MEIEAVSTYVFASIHLLPSGPGVTPPSVLFVQKARSALLLLSELAYWL